MEFEEKEFLVFHSVLRLLQHVDARRQMQVVYRLVDGKQPPLAQNALRQRVVNIFHGIALKQVFLQLLKEARREPVVAEFFREVVNAHHALWRLALLVSIHFGVNDTIHLTPAATCTLAANGVDTTTVRCRLHRLCRLLPRR